VFLFTETDSKSSLAPPHWGQDRCAKHPVGQTLKSQRQESLTPFSKMQKPHSWFFYLCAIEGAVATAALLSIPSEGGSLSPARLALVGFITLISIAW